MRRNHDGKVITKCADIFVQQDVSDVKRRARRHTGSGRQRTAAVAGAICAWTPKRSKVERYAGRLIPPVEQDGSVPASYERTSVHFSGIRRR